MAPSPMPPAASQAAEIRSGDPSADPWSMRAGSNLVVLLVVWFLFEFFGSVIGTELCDGLVA